MKTQDMNIVITGASSGIGKACAEKLFQAGANIIMLGRNTDALDVIKHRLETQYPDQSNHVSYKTLDLTNSAQRQQLVDDLLQAHTSINVLINNAGINHFGLLEQQSDEDIEQTFYTNAIAPILLCKSFLPILERQDESQIINIGSTFGSIGFPGFTSYSASKYALRGFSEALRRELSDSQIKIKYLSPRATQTPLNSDLVKRMNKELNVKMDTPDWVAENLIKLIETDQTELTVGWPEKLFTKVNQLFPSVVGNAIAKQLPIILRHANELRTN